MIALSAGMPFALRAGASSPVSNPGNVGVTLNLSVLTLSQSELGVASLNEARGSIDSNGKLSIPAANISFAPITLAVDFGDPRPASVVVDTVALTDFRGHIDPRTGRALFAGAVEQHWAAPGKLTDCPVGPFVISATTDALGSRGYNPATGNAMTIDDGFVLDKIPSATAGCDGHEGVINAALHLPINPSTTTTVAGPFQATLPSNLTADPNAPVPPPIPSIVLSVTVSPPPSAHGPPAPPVTTPKTSPPATVRRPLTPPEAQAAATARRIAREREVSESSGGSKKKNHSPPTTEAKTDKRAGASARYQQLPAIPDLTPPPVTFQAPPHKKSVGAALSALPASAIRTTTSGWMIVLPFLFLMAMGAAGVLLIKNEVVRTRPRHRLRISPVTKPPSDDE